MSTYAVDGWSDLQYVCVCPPEDDQKEKSLSHHTIQQLIMEKDQALADLNSVEKSLADLFRRYEKMKDVLEGFRKVTDIHYSQLISHYNRPYKSPGN